MNAELHQGDIIKVEKITKPVLITSKDFFNQTGEIIGCPIFQNNAGSPLHIKISTNSVKGYVQCEKITLLDLRVRGYSILDHVSLPDMINITDAIQSIFDYI